MGRRGSEVFSLNNGLTLDAEIIRDVLVFLHVGLDINRDGNVGTEVMIIGRRVVIHKVLPVVIVT